MSRKWISTEHDVGSLPSETWMSSETWPCRILFALKPKTKSSASIVLLLPDPFGPTMALKDCSSVSGKLPAT